MISDLAERLRDVADDMEFAISLETEAANKLEAQQAEISRLRAALSPFAEASLHLHPSHADDALTLDGIEVKHWRAARAALEAR